MYTDMYRYSHIYADMHRYELHTSKNYKTQKHCLQIQASLYELVQQSAVKNSTHRRKPWPFQSLHIDPYLIKSSAKILADMDINISAHIC